MNLYTPVVSVKGDARILNGRVLKIMYNYENRHCKFIDASDDKLLWETTAVMDIMKDDVSLVIRISSGNIYNFVNITSVIPTKVGE